MLDMDEDQILSVCSGIGGLDLGLSAGLRAVGRSPRTVCMVEREAFPVAVLARQMQERRMDECPLWLGDLRDLPLDELPAIDWITGGYPCQPWSAAGKRLGEADPRHLWPVILDIVRTLRPGGVFFENVGGHLSLGLDRVLQDLEGCGFGSAFGLFTAEEVGAPHRRERVFILGVADPERPRSSDRISTTTERKGSEESRDHRSRWPFRPGRKQHGWEPSRTTEPHMGRGSDGLPSRVDRLRALGNAVVPQQAEKAFVTLWKEVNRC